MCSNTDLLTIIGIAKKVLVILQIAIPIALLIFGTMDLGKAVMAGDEKEIKGNWGNEMFINLSMNEINQSIEETNQQKRKRMEEEQSNKKKKGFFKKRNG